MTINIKVVGFDPVSTAIPNSSLGVIHKVRTPGGGGWPMRTHCVRGGRGVRLLRTCAFFLYSQLYLHLINFVLYLSIDILA